MREFENWHVMAGGLNFDWLAENQEKVLIKTALEGTSYPYRFRRGVMSVSWAQKATEALVDMRLLKVAREELWQARRKHQVYGLTPLGFSVAFVIYLLKYSSSDKLRQLIISNESVIPLVLGKWDYFQRRGVEEAAFSRLDRVTNFFAKGYCDCLRLKRAYKYEVVKKEFLDDAVLTKQFTEEFYSLLPAWTLPTFSRKEVLKWYRVLLEEDDIKLIVLEILKDTLEQGRYLSQLAKEIMSKAKGTRTHGASTL